MHCIMVSPIRLRLYFDNSALIAQIVFTSQIKPKTKQSPLDDLPPVGGIRIMVVHFTVWITTLPPFQLSIGIKGNHAVPSPHSNQLTFLRV